MEPRQANDKDLSNKFNNDKAIYATPDVATPIIFGIVDRQKVPAEYRNMIWSTKWNSSNADTRVVPTALIPKEWQPYVENEFGWVYVLPPETFIESSGSQRKSKVSVEPIDKIKVTLQDFLDAGGKLKWI